MGLVGLPVLDHIRQHVPAMSSTVIIVLWLVTGAPAFDYVDRETCHEVKALTELTGKVEIELQDGSKLQADRVDCLELAKEADAAPGS